ncbi:MAG: phosphoribosyl-AMP cyclohydrolase [Desulfobacula sp.]|nr:phosphoribosyl-AMP cyclohydrolase [Desulfobacula sp.]
MEKYDFKLDFKKGNGLIPVIAQDDKTGEVLMLAYMNEQAFNETLKTGKATYYSRSRNALWKKGETSGHVQHVKEIRVDCDNDTILLKVDQVGNAACHKGYKSCFFSKIVENDLKIVESKIFDPNEVYK